MHNGYIRTGHIWTVGTTVLDTEWAAFDIAQYKSINGDDGGVWLPTSVIEIGGKGLQLDVALLGSRSVNANYVWDATGPDCVLLVDSSGAPGGLTMTLPPLTPNRLCVVKDAKQAAATHPITITRNTPASDTIDGVISDLVINGNNGSVMLLGTATGWLTIGKV